MERDLDQVSRIWKPVSYWSILGKGMRLSREQPLVGRSVARRVTTLITAAKETKGGGADKQKWWGEIRKNPSTSPLESFFDSP